MPSGRHPPQGLQVTFTSGPHPPQGGTGHVAGAGPNPPHRSQRSASDRFDEAQSFTRTEMVSVRLVGRRPRPFSVFVSSHTRGAILIESVEVSICEEDEPVFNIPVSDSGVVLKKPEDSQVFRLTDQQLAAISEHLEHGDTVKVTVRYLAADRSELKISIIEKEPHHKLRGVVATVALGFAVVSTIKYLLHSD
jgi:hypothetical protein